MEVTVSFTNSILSGNARILPQGGTLVSDHPSWVTKALFLKMLSWARMEGGPRKRCQTLGTPTKKMSSLSHQKFRNGFIHSSLLPLIAGSPSLAYRQPSEEAKWASKSVLSATNTHTILGGQKLHLGVWWKRVIGSHCCRAGLSRTLQHT